MQKTHTHTHQCKHAPCPLSLKFSACRLHLSVLPFLYRHPSAWLTVKVQNCVKQAVLLESVALVVCCSARVLQYMDATTNAIACPIHPVCVFVHPCEVVIDVD